MIGELFGQFGGYITLLLSGMASTFGFTWRFFVKPLEDRVAGLEAEIEEERQFRIKVQNQLLDMKTFSDDRRPGKK